MKTFKKTVEIIKTMRPCDPGLDFLMKQTSCEEAWKNCERGDWMIWYLNRTIASRRCPKLKLLTLAMVHCIRLRSNSTTTCSNHHHRYSGKIVGKAMVQPIDDVMYSIITTSEPIYANYAIFNIYEDTYHYDTVQLDLQRECAKVIREIFPKPPKIANTVNCQRRS